MNKRKIAQHFSKAAHTYGSHNSLQQQCAQQLLQLLPTNTGITLDAGCGPGVNTAALQQRAQVYIGCDLAYGMLQQAQASHQGHFLQGDIEQLPVAHGSIDTVFANLALQWVSDLPHALSQLCDCLRPQGRCVVSTVLSGSLMPLGRCFEQATGSARHNQFISAEALTEALEHFVANARDALEYTLLQQQITVPYTQVRDMLLDLKGIGATYQPAGRQQLTRKGLAQVEDLMEAYRQANGMLPLHWNIAFIELRKG